MSGIRIYACGGTGIGIVKKIRNLQPVKSAAVPKIVYCDTSESDMLTGYEKEDKFIIANVDGAGKLQKEHALDIRNAVPDLINKFTPESLNIIVASSSGGTGSTFAIELSKALLAEGYPTIIQLVTTSEDARATRNTIQTLKHLSFISGKMGIPILLNIVNQESASDEEYSDDTVIERLAALLVLGGGQNVGLDTRDIANFVYFNRVTEVPPRLLSLDISYGDSMGKAFDGCEIVTLVESIPAGGVPCNLDSLYRASGHGTGDIRITMFTHGGTFEHIIADLEARLSHLNELTTRLTAPAIDTGSESGDDFYG